MTRQNWIVEDGAFGHRMVLQGAWTGSAERAFRKGDVCELELNTARGWPGGDVSFLGRIRDFLVWLRLLDFGLASDAAVSGLVRLRHLDLNAFASGDLDLTGLRDLRSCALQWRDGLRSLFLLEQLQRVFLNEYLARDLSAFAVFGSLRELRINGAKRLESIGSVGDCASLEVLELAGCPRLSGLLGIEQFRSLSRLELHGARRVGSLRGVGALTKLEELFLIGCGDVESLAPLARLESLRTLVFSESTNVLDGDLSCLHGLRSLERVAFRDRRHYSHRSSDFAC